MVAAGPPIQVTFGNAAGRQNEYIGLISTYHLIKPAHFGGNMLIGESRRSIKVRIGHLLSNAVLGTLISSVFRNRIRNKGVIIDTSPPAFTAVVKAQLAFGIYESAEIRFIRKYLSGCSRVLELGASLGVTAAHILDVAAPGAEVVCVEANPDLLAALQLATATAAERTGAKVKTIHGAVPSDPNIRSPSVVLTLGGSHLGSRVGTAGGGDPGRQIRVPAIDLAEVVRGWTDYALVCDIEGAEAALILSAQPVLTGASRLVIELHEASYGEAVVTVAHLREVLLNMGFLLVAEKGSVLVLHGPADVCAKHQARLGHPAQHDKVREDCG